jgi:hypothetical protein
MDDPTFRMRAKIASRASGHVFEDRFLKLEGIQLFVAYRQALKEEEEEFGLVKTLNDVWTKKLDNFFKVLYMMVDGDKWALIEEMKELGKLREEVKPEEFPTLWSEFEQWLPSEIVVEEPEQDPLSHIPTIDPELDEMITGFVPYKFKKEGD